MTSIFSGMYYDPDCSSEDLNHSVLVVSYGFEEVESDNNKYWIVKIRYKIPEILTFYFGKGILSKSVFGYMSSKLGAQF